GQGFPAGRACHHRRDWRGARFGRFAAERAHRAAREGSGSAPLTARDPRVARCLQAGLGRRPYHQARGRVRLSQAAGRSRRRRRGPEGSEEGAHVFSAAPAARSVRHRSPARACRELGQAHLRQPARRSARGRRRLRRLHPLDAGRHQRPAAQGVVMRRRGFTLIELLVVLSIVALLLTLAIPRYFGSIDKSKEAVLRENLNQMREAISRYYADKGKYPESLESLAAEKYLRSVPYDPVSQSDKTGNIVQPE